MVSRKGAKREPGVGSRFPFPYTFRGDRRRDSREAVSDWISHGGIGPDKLPASGVQLTLKISMFASRTTRFIVGILVLVGVAAIMLFAFSRLKMLLLDTSPSYTLFAEFDNSSGLKGRRSYSDRGGQSRRSLFDNTIAGESTGACHP